MIKKVAILLTVVVGLILSVTYVASGSPISASQSLQELPDRSAAVSGLSGSYRTMVTVDPCDVDFDGSGVVDVGDIMLVADCWRMTDNDPNWDARYDLDGDGIITIVDIMLVAAQWGKSCPPTSTPPWAIDIGFQDADQTLRDLAVDAGFHLVRTGVSWSSIEPNEPVNGVHTYHWPDSLFDIYRNDRRLIPLVVISNNPGWAVPSGQRTCGPIKSSRLDDFGEFVYQLVARYADVTPYWVFYNEEDQYTDCSDCDQAGGCWGGHGDKYAQMLAVAWEEAHSANPNAQVIFGAPAYEPLWSSGWDVWDWFFFRDAFEYMKNHPDDYVDIISANQYTFRREEWQGALPENQDIIAKFQQAKSDASFDPDTRGAYSVARWQSEYGLDKPMATGEVGLFLGNSSDEEPQARHVVHVNVRGLAADLKIIIWFMLKDSAYGLIRADGTLRPAYDAYQVLTQQLDGYVFDRQLVPGNPRIQAYRFDRDGVKKLVLWRDDGKPIKLQNNSVTETMTVSAAGNELGTWTGQVRVTDKLGNPTIYNGVSSVSLTFSSDPIYVEAVQ